MQDKHRDPIIDKPWWENHFFVNSKHISFPHGFVGKPNRTEKTVCIAPCHPVLSHSQKEDLFLPSQEGACNVLTITPDNRQEMNKVQADGIVTCHPYLPIGVRTADCASILFWDPQGIVGVAHAGCRGAALGIIENTIHAMCSLGARRENLCAVIGPTIHVRSYPVGPEYLSMIQSYSSFDIYPFIEKERFFNLPAYTHYRLRTMINTVYSININTYGSRFFSHRYNSLLSLPSTQHQRNISWIALSIRKITIKK